MTDNTNLAASWLQALAARGVRCTIRNGRLRMYPQAAYKDLSDDERAVLRHHRDEIKALIAAGVAPVALALPVLDSTASGSSPAAAPTIAPEPLPPLLCPFCRRTCVGPDHFAYEVLHYDDPEEIKKRNEAATAVMMKMVGKPLPDWWYRR